MKSRLAEHLVTDNIDNDYIPTDFSLYAKNQVKNILKNGINDQAINRQNVEAITIDGVESMDLDDAIWAEKTQNGYCVWIHIADVSEFIPIYSPLDIEAFKRTTSIYRKNSIINMIPDELADDVISLNQNGPKKVLSLQIDLDEQAIVQNYKYYESHLTNLMRYDYSSFGEDFENRDSNYNSQIHLLHEISNKLLINRLKSGSIIGYEDEDRRLFLGEKLEKPIISYSEKISHSIIESLMVLANTTTGRYLSEQGVDAIYKKHESLGERGFYTSSNGYHIGLGVNNYTHFTSPIRRYIDIIVHRIIKSIERKEELPYKKNDLELISDHSNNTRLKIEVLGSEACREMKAEQYLEKTKNRLGQDPEVYDIKDYIRISVSKHKKMPNCMKEAIKHKIDTTSIGKWGWVVGVILFGKDKDLKEYLRDKLLTNRELRPGRILNMIVQTQILRGEQSIFESREIENSNTYSLEILLHGNRISYCSSNTGKLGDMNQIKGKVRLKIIEKIFDYFISL